MWSRFPFPFFYLLPLAWLWFRLIDHLRVEWSVNPQYAYGWAVPFLCLYLVWRKIGMGKAETLKPETLKPLGPGAGEQPPFSFSAFQLFSVCLLGLLYLPTRLVQEANPEWRLVSWALAFEVIGLTLLCIRFALGAAPAHRDLANCPFRVPFQLSAFSISDFVFPICFFLVAVPWPTFIEGPVTQGLMRANVRITIELLALIGVPAVQHGNVIEVASGMVGIDDACSGIRSLQAALMIALFLGELYSLSARRRALCVFAGFALAFLFNVGRTLLLTWVASAKGVGAVASWHDPAGVTILVACFLCLWLIAWAIRGKAETLKAEILKSLGQNAESIGGKAETLKAEPASNRGGFSVSACQRFSIFLTAWLVLVEGGTELWYRSHEWGVSKAAAWQVEFPRENPSFRELPFSDKTKQFLRYDEGLNGTWQEGENRRWQAIFFHWNPGRIAVHLAKSHTPEVCLTAAGREVVSKSGLRAIPVHGLQLPFRSYVVKDANGPLHVFYCLWEDRANTQAFRTTRMTYANRLAPVLAGLRNSGQRSLEVAIWGAADQQEAEVALTRQLQKLINVRK